MTKKEVKKIKSVQTYKITWTEFEDGNCSFNRVNDGFHALELLGLLEMMQTEILEQMRGNVKPHTTVKKLIVRK